MNKENAAQFLPLVQALADGKTIQVNYSIGGWLDEDEPRFDPPADRYRVKPEPREFWIARGYAYNSYDAAAHNHLGENIIHTLEVL